VEGILKGIHEERDFPRDEILDSGLAYMKKSYPRNETVYRSVIYVSLILILLLAQQPLIGQGLLSHEVFRSHKTMHHSR